MNTLLELPGADVGGLRNSCVMATLLITQQGPRTLKSHPITFCPNYSLERRHKQYTIAGMEGVKIGNYSVRTSSSLGTLYFHRKIPATEKPFRIWTVLVVDVLLQFTTMKTELTMPGKLLQLEACVLSVSQHSVCPTGTGRRQYSADNFKESCSVLILLSWTRCSQEKSLSRYIIIGTSNHNKWLASRNNYV